MNPRVDPGTIVSSDSKKIIVYDRDVNKKLEKISASAFEILKTQLEEKRKDLLSALKTAESIEPKSHYYASKFLQDKFLGNCREALSQPSVEFPLEYIQEKRQAEFDATLRLINKNYDAVKEKVKANLLMTEEVAGSIDQLETPLILRLSAFKQDLIETLQNVASEYRLYLISRGEWQKKFPEFTDKFGCVVSIIGSMHPYELDKTVGYGLEFGHEIRCSGRLARMASTVSSIKKMSLTDIEKIINRVINECRYYSTDSYDVLNSLKKHFEKLTREKYRGFIEFEEDGRYYRYLKSIIFLKKDEDLVKQPLEFAKTQLQQLESHKDEEVAQQIKVSLKHLQDAVNVFKSNADKDILLLNNEARLAVDFFKGSSVKYYNEIAALNATMKSANIETKTLVISVDTTAHKVQLAYEDAIKFAKLMDQAEFGKYAKIADESLAAVNAKMQDLDAKFTALNKYERIIEKKLTTAKEKFNGSIHRIPLAKYAREAGRHADLLKRYDLVKKDYDAVNVLPKAIKAYGDFHFDCASAKSIINDSNESLAAIPQTIQTLWGLFNQLIDEANEKKEFKLVQHQARVEQEFASAAASLKKSEESLVSAGKLRDQAILKLSQAREVFPGEIHVEHQETFDTLVMHYSDAIKKYRFEETNLAPMKLVSQAMQDYSGIVLNTALMKEEAMFVTRSCQTLSTAVEEIKSAHDEAARLKKAGVIKHSLETMAKIKLNEAELALAGALSALKKAEVIKLSEQKALAEAKDKYPREVHTKPQEIFDLASNSYAQALVCYGSARAELVDATHVFENLQQQLVLAKHVENEKQLATQLRQLLLKSILNNLSLWKPGKWGGGMDYQYDGKHYCIPHGVYELITGLNSSADHAQWIKAVLNSAKTRDDLASSWRYSLFSIRNEQTTGALYHAIKTNLKLDGHSIQSLHAALTKIPGLVLEEKRETSVILAR